MMKRFAAASVVALSLGLAACGGGDEGDPTASPDAASSPASDATAAPTRTPTPESVMPTPTPLNAGDPIVSIVAAGNPLAPTAGEFSAWPQTTLTADGGDYTGVTLSDVATQAGASGGFFEIEGTRSDGVRFAIARHSVEEIGASSLLVLTESGQLNFVSSALDPAQWMTAVTAISFV